ncbi:hypothetical protein BN1708_009476 [Verticillium longisporum]|uniref:Uncharacterized protein n=1 Tax=Verticillium longisporum TaxID=100787 RepID=A0A0G4KHV4_VERLO|nr:hypothetical protein BN1708_009476 [Verticillium longisporum]
MMDNEKHDCRSLQVLAWEEETMAEPFHVVCCGGGRRGKTGAPEVSPGGHELLLTLCIHSQANAERTRSCHLCRRAFTKAFLIPELWWSDYSKRSNGYFGCDTTGDDEGNIATVKATWSRYLVKQLAGKEKIHHAWYKINVVVRWSATPNQTVVLIFDAPKELEQRLPRPLLEPVTRELLRDPFLIHLCLAEEVVRVQNDAVWSLRTYVRDLEKQRTGEDPSPDYQRLHDLARHAIHICETLDLGVVSMESTLAHHAVLADEPSAAAPAAAHRARFTHRHVHQRLQFFKHMFESLRCRSASNKERLDNEMQLAFHTVAQHDSRTGVEIARAAQSDSAAMKTISFLTLAFLPATFISAVFSMSFFNVDDDTGEWSVSNKIWIYWAFAVPVTLVTTGLWYRWQRKLYRPMIKVSHDKTK